MNNHNLSNLNYKFIECEEYAPFVKKWFEQIYTSIEDTVDDYLMIHSCSVKHMSRDYLEIVATRFGVMDLVNYKNKSILLHLRTFKTPIFIIYQVLKF